MYNNSDELVFKLNAVESTCAVEFYTVVDTSRSPVHNIPCPLHWVRDNSHFPDFLTVFENVVNGNPPLFQNAIQLFRDLTYEYCS